MLSVIGRHPMVTTTVGEFVWRCSLSQSYSFSADFSCVQRGNRMQSIAISANENSPRWLIEQDRSLRARQKIAWLRALDSSHLAILKEVHDLEKDSQKQNAATNHDWTVLFTHRPLFKRLWRASLLQFMAQMCGNVSLKYYLPTILMGLGVPRKTTLLIGGIELTIKLGFTIIDTWVMDYYGRRLTLIVSCLVMSVALLVEFSFPFKGRCHTNSSPS